MTPQQALFTEILTTLRENLPYPICDGSIPRSITFPYIYIGDGIQTDDQTKSCLIGNIQQTIHVWHDDPEKRGELSDVMGRVITHCRRLARREYSFEVKGMNQRIISDESETGKGGGGLLHGIINLYVTFSPSSTSI